MPRRHSALAFDFESQVYRALADPTRMAIVCVLTQGAQCVNELANTLRRPQSTVSRHLRVLHDALLVNASRHGQSVVYTLSDRRICQVIELLRTVSCDTLIKSAHNFGAFPNRNKTKGT
jgi:DNA-binding transcriptional ArsR family regulator